MRDNQLHQAALLSKQVAATHRAGNPDVVVNLAPTLHRHTPVADRHSSQHTMPKIRTTRTKKPPEGFEDIEGVSYIELFTLIVLTATSRFSMSTRRR